MLGIDASSDAILAELAAARRRFAGHETRTTTCCSSPRASPNEGVAPPRGKS
jgi:hypothetical protein